MENKFSDDYHAQFRSKEEIAHDDKLAAAHEEHMHILHICGDECPYFNEDGE